MRSGHTRAISAFDVLMALIEARGGVVAKNLECPLLCGAMEGTSETPAGLAFGRFRVLPHRRELLAGGQPIKLGGRS
jgi:hypothetical protein